MDDLGNVLVVGAQTAAGQAYAKALRLAGYRVWAPLQPLEDARPLTSVGARPVAVSMLDSRSIRRAVSETMAVVIALGGSSGGLGAGSEDVVTARLIDAARAEPVHHLVFSSVLHADRASPVVHFRQRAALEELVVESGLPYTILRPAPLMEALAEGPLSTGVRQTGVVRSPIKGDVPVSYIAARDLGRFAVLALENAELNCQTVDVGGPEAITFEGLLPWLSRVFRRPMAYNEMPLRKLKRHLGEHGVQLIAHMNQHGYQVDMSPVLEWLETPLVDLRTFLSEAWQRAEAEAASQAEHGRSAWGRAQTEAA